MVSHGTAKKRRRGIRVSRRQQKNVKLRISNKLNDEIKKVYDKEKSPSENLETFGLRPDSNMFHDRSHPQKDGSAPKSSKLAAFVGMAVIPNGQGLPVLKEKKNTMSDFESRYAKTNIDKHGDNYKAMERDMDTNFFQYTQAKMQKICEKYRELQGSS